MQAGRTSAQIKTEIERLFGIFPSFFHPVLDTPETLESLLQQALTSYVNNPLPAVFKEKLFARLSRHCATPYCLVTHSCMMRFLGQSAGEIARVLESPTPATEADLEEPLHMLAAATAPMPVWPEPGSRQEEALLLCAEISFLNSKGAVTCRAELRRLLGPVNHAHLMRFLSFVKLAHLWIEAYPEISYQEDERTMELLASLVRDEPRLADFFSRYPEIVRCERESREERLSTELADLKRIEEALRVSEEQVRLILDSTAEGIFGCDSNGTCLFCNRAAAHLLGYDDPAELLGRNMHALEHHTRADGTPYPIEECPIYIGFQKGEGVHRDDEVYWRKDGTSFPVEFWSHPIVRDGRTTGAVVTFVDITERKRADEALRQYVERLRILQEIDRSILAAQSAVEIASVALRRLREMVPTERITVVLRGPAPDEATVLATDEDAERNLEAGKRLPLEPYGNLAHRISETLQRGETYFLDVLDVPDPVPAVRDMQATGRRYYFIVPLLVHGELIGSLSLGTNCASDLTAEHLEVARGVADGLAIAVQQARLHERIGQHAAELEQRVAERTAELEAFSYSVSHDLRTPLLTIDGFSRMLLEDHSDGLDEEGRRLLKTICGNSQNMGRLIDDLLAFSRLGRQEMRPAEIKMSELAAAVCAELTAVAPERKLQFNLQTLPPAHGDQPMIKQVFVNLLANAIKFSSPRDLAVIEVGAAAGEDQNVYYVKDNGVGFEMKYADKLFGVFQRLHSDDEFAGTGVGLAFVQRIIHRHGGRVWAEGKIGEGATVYFTLPRKGRKSW